jgi:hypothetical protein
MGNTAMKRFISGALRAYGEFAIRRLNHYIVLIFTAQCTGDLKERGGG